MPDNAAPMTHIPAPAPPLSAARQADAASQLADRLSARPADATFGDGFAAVTHALLAAAAATQAAGNDVSDALAGVAAHLADIDASLAVIAGTGSRHGRWRPWRRRRHSAAGQAGGAR